MYVPKGSPVHGDVVQSGDTVPVTEYESPTLGVADGVLLAVELGVADSLGVALGV